MDDNIHIKSFKTSRGGVKLNWEGFIYEKYRVISEKQYWVCELRSSELYKCNSRIITKYDEEKKMYKLKSISKNDHNHDPDALKEKVHNTINAIKDDALKNLEKKPIHIIEHCVASTSSHVLANLPSNLNLRQTIYRQRNKLDKIKEPDSIDFVINRDILKMNENEDILIDKMIDVDKRIIIYTSKKLLTLLCSSFYLIMDGTFKVAPVIFKQIYTIHGCVSLKTFPMVITLCTNKDKITYDKLFSTLIEYCESLNLTLSPQYILMDFEKASQLSAKTVFQNPIIKGCYFHLGQIIYRQVQSKGFQKLYGTDELFSSEIRSLLALAYLPAEDIPVYFDALMENISSNAKIIAEWFKDNYVWGTYSSPPKYDPKMWSTHELNERNIPRTQNSAESWHNRFNNLVGKHHASFYFLSKKIVIEIKHQTAEIEKHLNGGPPAQKKRKYTIQSNRIENVLKNKTQYSNKSDYLKALASNIKLL